MNRAERRRRTSIIVRRRIREAKLFDLHHPSMVGRMKIMSPFDCGRPKCFVCGSRRRFEGPTRQEVQQELAFNEYFRELG